MKQKTVITWKDALIILGIIALMILAAGIDSFTDAIANFLTK